MDRRPDGTAIEATVTNGRLRGVWRDGIARFAGIPFAAPPLGDRRFRPPTPPDPWEGVRPADAFGPVSPQNPSVMDALFGGVAEQWDEDCLYLNVWSPDPGPDASLPVMVWIHGGGFEIGSGSSPLYDGTSFARNGVVLVTLNYRLGALGFLELGHMDASYSGSGNIGLLDQVAALEWVRDNIDRFGGDPGRVTIFGESAGAMSVSLLMTMPRARGLFHGAIAQSGATSSARTPELATEDAAEFAQRCARSGVQDLLDAPIEELLSAHAAMGAARAADPEAVVRRTGSPLSFLSFRPVANGIDVPADPVAALAAGSSSGVPLLIGTNSEEWKLFALASPSASNDAELRSRFEALVADPDAAIEAYQKQHPGATPADLECALITDLVFRTPANRVVEAHAAHAPVFQYLWTWPSPAFGGLLGAAHAIEIPFVFDLVEDHRLHMMIGPDAPTHLSAATHAAWIEFAHRGAPAAPGLPAWSPVALDERPVMVLDAEPALVPDPLGLTRSFWDTPAAAMPTR